LANKTKNPNKFKIMIPVVLIDKLIKLGKGILEQYIMMLRYIDRRKNKNSNTITFTSTFLAFKMGINRTTFLNRAKLLYEVGLIDWNYFPTINGKYKTTFNIYNEVSYIGDELTKIRSWNDRSCSKHNKPVDNFASQSCVKNLNSNNNKRKFDLNNNHTKAEKLKLKNKKRQLLKYLYGLQDIRVKKGENRYGWRSHVVNTN